MHSSSATNSQQKEIYTEMLATANEIKDYNYRSYFTRRVTQDMESETTDEIEELEDRLRQLKRIAAV